MLNERSDAEGTATGLNNALVLISVLAALLFAATYLAASHMASLAPTIPDGSGLDRIAPSGLRYRLWMLVQELSLSAVFATVAWLILYFALVRTGIVRRRATAEVHDVRRVVEDVQSEGLQGIEGRLNQIETLLRSSFDAHREVIAFYTNWREVDWRPFLENVTHLDIIVSYWGGWIAQYREAISAIFARGGAVTIVLPDPDAEEAVRATQRKFPELSENDVRVRVLESVRQLLIAYDHAGERGRTQRATLAVHFHGGPLHYAAARIDDRVLFSGIYEHHRQRAVASHALFLDLEQSPYLRDFWERQFAGFWDDTDSTRHIPLRDLRSLVSNGPCYNDVDTEC